MKRLISALVAMTLMLTLACGCAKKSGLPYDYDVTKYVTLGDYVGIEYTYEEAEVTDKAVDDYIRAALIEEGYGEDKEIKDRAIQNGDTVNIKFVGKLDGKEFEGGSSESYDLVIGSNSFIEGFEAGLVGVKLGETVDLNLKFPDNYGKEELNGKPVVFTVTVNSIKVKVYPELTDEIVSELSDKKTVAEYLEFVNSEVAAQNKQNAVNEKENEIWTKIVEKVTVTKLPEDEVKHQKELITESYDKAADQQYGTTYEEVLKQMYGMTAEEIDAELTTQAESAVKEYLTIVAIARDQDLDVTKEEYQKEADKYAAANSYASTDEFLKAIDESQFYLTLLIERVMDFVVENAVEVK